MTKVTHSLKMAIAVTLAGATGCSSSADMFPDSITFGQRTLGEGSSWSRGGMSAIVYVPTGETLPSASLQVGVIVSSEHRTAAALHAWVDQQARAAENIRFHNSSAAEESCRIARTVTRTYITLQVCKTGIARAACVEADETADWDRVERCLGRSDSCFEDLCDQRWIARREALDLLVADVLTKR